MVMLKTNMCIFIIQALAVDLHLVQYVTKCFVYKSENKIDSEIESTIDNIIFMLHEKSFNLMIFFQIVWIMFDISWF